MKQEEVEIDVELLVFGLVTVLQTLKQISVKLVAFKMLVAEK